MTPFQEFQRVTLKITEYKIAQSIANRELQTVPGNIKMDFFAEHMADRLVAALSVFLAQGKTTETGGTVKVEYPDGWWEAFRQRWFDNRLLRWHLRRRQIRMKVVKVPQRIEITRVCPHFPTTGDMARQGRRCVEFLMEPHRY